MIDELKEGLDWAYAILVLVSQEYEPILENAENAKAAALAVTLAQERIAILETTLAFRHERIVELNAEVANAHERIAELEAENAALRADAETGTAVEGMGVDTMLWRTVIGWRHLCGADDCDWPEDYRVIIQALLLDGETFELSLHDSAIAALRAAKGDN